MARKIAEKDNCSYIFGESSREIFCKEYKNNFQHYSNVIRALFLFALKDLFVIRNTHSGVISANFLLPMAFKIEKDEIRAKGDFAVSLTEPVVLSEEESRFWISLLPRSIWFIYDHSGNEDRYISLW